MQQLNASQRPVRPALQARSRKTLNAMLDAVDLLLRDRSFEAITLLDIARTARVSTGAFYARFKSKDDLLPELYARYQRSLDDLLERDFDPSTWSALDIDARLERVAAFLCDMFESRSWLLRAMVIHSRRRYPQAIAGEADSSSQVRLMRRLADCLDVAPESLPRDRVEFALYTAITLAREAILFPHLPMATALGLNAGTIRQRLPMLLRAQLGLAER